MAVLVKVDGTEIDINVRGRSTSLGSDMLKRLVGDKLQLILLDARSAMISNPSVTRASQLMNRKANHTLVFAAFHPLREMPELIYGDALIAGYDEFNLMELLRDNI